MPLKHEEAPDLFLKWARGNKDAAEFMDNVAKITRLADDIVDGASSDPQRDMMELLERAIVINQSNAFFRAHADKLVPIMVLAGMMWRKGDEWRKSPSRKTRLFGFVYREGIEHVAHTVALITGGMSHALEVMEELHRIANIEGSDEMPEDWERE